MFVIVCVHSYMLISRHLWGHVHEWVSVCACVCDCMNTCTCVICGVCECVCVGVDMWGVNIHKCAWVYVGVSM